MLVRLGVARNAVNVLNKISMESGMKVSAAYRLSKLLKSLSKELEDFEVERAKLVKKYGEERGEGFEIVDDGKRTVFINEIKELLDVEIDVPGNKFKPEDFEGAHLSAQDFIALEFMIEE